MIGSLLAGRARTSASALALALALASAWWSATTSMLLLHDDARFVHSLSAALDEPGVRAELGRWLGQVLEQGSTLSATDLAVQPVVTVLRDALASDQEVGPMADALSGVLVTARDQAVDQLDRRITPKQPVRIDLGPLLTAAGVKVDTKTARQLGLKLDRSGRRPSIGSELFSADQLQRYQWRYDLTRLTRDLGGWAALVLLALAVATSRRPFVTLAVACGVGAVAAGVAPMLLTRLATWVGVSELGAWSSAFVVGLGESIRGVPVPMVLVGSVGLVGFLAVHLVLHRQRGGRGPGDPDGSSAPPA